MEQYLDILAVTVQYSHANDQMTCIILTLDMKSCLGLSQYAGLCCGECMNISADH